MTTLPFQAIGHTVCSGSNAVEHMIVEMYRNLEIYDSAACASISASALSAGWPEDPSHEDHLDFSSSVFAAFAEEESPLPEALENDLATALSDIAPVGSYFGAAPGEPTHYGWWPKIGRIAGSWLQSVIRDPNGSGELYVSNELFADVAEAFVSNASDFRPALHGETEAVFPTAGDLDAGEWLTDEVD